MKTLYIECNMGAAGDMLCGALLEIYGDTDGFIEMMNNAGIPGVRFAAHKCMRCGIAGTKAEVTVNGHRESPDGGDSLHSRVCSGHDKTAAHMHERCPEHEHNHSHQHEHRHEHEHNHGHQHEHEHCRGCGHNHSHGHHTSRSEIFDLINSLNIPERAKDDAKAVYSIIADAEAKAHNTEPDNIHFHEVGTMDAVADVVSVCCLVRLIGADRIICSPICTGSGTVRCAHGILSVPVPAVCEILKDAPVYAGNIQSELCTPTGAALIKYFADEFSNMPMMRIERTGIGMGTKEFGQMNGVRIFIGETGETVKTGDKVYTIRCNIDDMTGEDIGYAVQKLMEEGALDVFTVPAQMKKNRPGIVLVCICAYNDRDKMTELIFRHTTTCGVRFSISERAKLSSSFRTVRTEYGDIRIKCSRGFKTEREKPEFEDIRRIAEENGISAAEVRSMIKNQT